MSEKAVRKYKEHASRLIAKGKIQEALVEYQKAVKEEPRDLSLRQKLAETYSRLGKREEAIHEYQTVAGSYAADGLLLKAIAICKVILALDPAHRETQGILADLYTQKSGNLQQPVVMPKSMSAAIGNKTGAGGGQKRSAAEIRGVAADSLAPHSLAPHSLAPHSLAPPRPVRPPREIPLDDEVLEIDAEVDGVEVLSVEDAPALVGTPLATNLNEILSMSAEPPPLPLEIDGSSIPGPDDRPADFNEVSADLDIVVEEPAELVLGTVVGEPAAEAGNGEAAALPADDELVLGEESGAVIEAGPDEVLLEIAEPAQVDVQELPPIPLFSDLPREAFIALTERMELVQSEPGEILIAEGEYAASMYIVIQGKVKVVREIEGGEELKLADLGDGAFFGEMALLSDAPRTASVIAVEETMLFEISRDLMNEITREHPTVDAVLKRFHRNRLLTNLLRTSPIFAPFSPQDKKDLIEKFKSRNVEADKLLITKDKPGDGLYVLLSGRCEVLGRKEGQEREVVLAELKEGDVFGEMALLFHRFTTASVRTTSPCIVLRLPKQAFDELIMTHPQVLETLSRLSEERTSLNKEILSSDEETLQDFLA